MMIPKSTIVMAQIASVVSLVLLALLSYYVHTQTDYKFGHLSLFGGLLAWVNLVALSSAWILFFEKKRVALAFAIIITKYAFLMLIIYWLVVGYPIGNRFTTLEYAAVALGFVAYLFMLLAALGLGLAIKGDKSKNDER